MFRGTVRTLNNKRTPSQIEQQFEIVRSAYLSDLAKLRKQYELKFIELSSEYNNAYTISH